MKIISETSLTQFDFWSGAKTNAEQFTYSELESLENELEVLYPDGMTDTEINDLMWFEPEYLAELIGKEWKE